MNRNIDDIFKEGIGDMEFSGKEEIWERMEKQLDNEATPGKKRRFVYLLLPLLFILSTVFLAIHFNNNKTKYFATQKLSPVVVASGNTDSKAISLFKSPAVLATANNQSGNSQHLQGFVHTATRANQQHEQLQPGNSNRNKAIQRKGTLGGSLSVDLQQAEIEESNSGDQENIFTHKANGLFYLESYGKPAAVLTNIAGRSSLPGLFPVQKESIKKISKWSLDAVAGSDIFNLNKGAGYYAGLKINRPFNKGMSLSVGINYSMTRLSESYRLSDKPLQQQQADAEISRMEMLRFPVMIEQQIGNSRFTAAAGLVPVYILNASIYNLPPSDSANLTNYRQFGINDIKRLNILFSAGLRYNIFSRLAIDVTGSYGLTEMVKNSYINQSSVNGNFKNVQVGLRFQLK